MKGGCAFRGCFLIALSCFTLCMALENVGLIVNGAMRFHDNPTLSQFLACRTERSAVFLLPDWNGLIVRDSMPSLIDDLREKFYSRKIDFCPLTGEPTNDLDTLKARGVEKLIHTDRLSHTAVSLIAQLSDGAIASMLAEDSIVEVPPQISTFDSRFYASERVKPLPPSTIDNHAQLNGESRALQLVREYLTLGDASFSRKYAQDYVGQGPRSAYHALSLSRLCGGQFFEGEVLSALLAPLTALGCISPRVLYHAQRVLGVNGRHASAAARVLRKEAVRGDWHRHLARRTRALESASSPEPRRWHKAYSFWGGYQQRQACYRGGSVSGNSTTKPVLLLLHGFGGSIDQHTALAEQLCDHFEVHAIDSLGFGGSEKPPLSYNQYLWSDQAVEYLEDLARARNLTAVPMEVVLAGNSIGGYTAATAAAAIATRMREQRALSAPPLLNCTGLVLFNTAGVIRNNTGVMQEPAQFPPYQGLPSGVLGVAGSALTSLLRARIGPTCSWLYATEPEYPLRNGLVGQIYRDSCDPGAAGLFAAGGKLPPPRSMNTLLGEFCGPVLVAQGALDPLNDAVGRAYALRSIRPGIQVALMRLGHCPMDEGAAEVGREVTAWARANGI